MSDSPDLFTNGDQVYYDILKTLQLKKRLEDELNKSYAGSLARGALAVLSFLGGHKTVISYKPGEGTRREKIEAAIKACSEHLDAYEQAGLGELVELVKGNMEN